MENAITFFIYVSVIFISIWAINYNPATTSSESKNRNKSDTFIFGLPFITTLIISCTIMEEVIYLPVALTVASIAGVFGLLVKYSAWKLQ